MQTLKPRKTRPKKLKIAVFDIEANNWIEFAAGGFYDGRVYTQHASIAELSAHIFSKKYRGYTIFGHYAGKFDSLFLLHHVQKSGKQFQIDIISQGSKAILIKFRSSKHTWNIGDTSAIFPGQSLDKLTKSFDVEHKKLSGTIDFSAGEKFDISNPLHCSYLKNDCLGLYEVIQKYKSMPKIKEEGMNITVASQALRMWQRTLKQPIKTTPHDVQDFVRQSYFGGRVEIFKTKGHNLSYYDVNSLYPYVMRHSRLPIELDCGTRTLDHRLAFFDCTVRATDQYIPILPLKIDRRLIFPNGTFRGVFFSEELKLALENGYTIEKIHEGYRFFESQDLFNEYIDYWYTQKKTSQKGSAQELTAKLFMNGLYGKFGQKEVKKVLKTYDEKDINFEPFHSDEIFQLTGLIEKEISHRSPHMLVHLASAITSYSRMHMAKLCYIPHQENCFYTDTDSIMTDAQFKTGPELGELKLEDTGFTGLFKLPKAYMRLKDDKPIETKIKGFSRKFAASLTKENFNSNNISEFQEKPCSLKTSLIRNKCYLSKVGMTKRVMHLYDKRRVLKNGDTEPWVIKDGVIINQPRR